MKTSRSQRGSALLIATLAMLALIAASTGAMIAVVVAHAQRVTHQACGVQALYLAEMGVEELLTLHAEGRPVSSLRRAIPREREQPPTVAGPVEPPAADKLDQGPQRALVGTYEVSATRTGQALVIRSVGTVVTPGGRPVVREVRVTCCRMGGRWVPERWEQVP